MVLVGLYENQAEHRLKRALITLIPGKKDEFNQEFSGVQWKESNSQRRGNGEIILEIPINIGSFGKAERLDLVKEKTKEKKQKKKKVEHDDSFEV